MHALRPASRQPRSNNPGSQLIFAQSARWVAGVIIVLSSVPTLPASGVRADEPVRVADSELVTLWQWGSPGEDTCWNYVIAHGMGGTRPGDRFHLLAAAIRRECPDCSVTLLDWSASATKTRYGMQ